MQAYQPYLALLSVDDTASVVAETFSAFCANLSSYASVCPVVTELIRGSANGNLGR